jgi:hypothetical protein
VIGELVAGDPVHASESYWDAFAFMDESGERNGVVITRGAGNGAIVAGVIPARATVYAWKQNDEVKNGKRAGDEWLKDLAAHACVKVLWPKTPEQFKDLNDWTRAGATPDDLLQAMLSAEMVREADSMPFIHVDGTDQSPHNVIEPGSFPIDALNPVMRAISEQSAEVYQIKPELPGMAGVAVLAGANGKSFIVTGAVSGRETHCNVYVIPGAPKSYGKNAAAIMAAPLREASNELGEAFLDGESPKLITEQKILKKRDEDLVKRCAGTGNKADALTESDRDEMRSELVKIQRRLAEIESLLKWPPTYLIGNATSAALTEMLKRNGETIFSFSPEAGELVRIALGKFNKDRAADFDLFLSGSTVESARETRIGRGDSGDFVPCISAVVLSAVFAARTVHQ